jgi:hypothetical protein
VSTYFAATATVRTRIAAKACLAIRMFNPFLSAAYLFFFFPDTL